MRVDRMHGRTGIAVLAGCCRAPGVARSVRMLVSRHPVGSPSLVGAIMSRCYGVLGPPSIELSLAKCQLDKVTYYPSMYTVKWWCLFCSTRKNPACSGITSHRSALSLSRRTRSFSVGVCQAIASRAPRSALHPLDREARLTAPG